MSNVSVKTEFNLNTSTWAEAIDNLDHTINNKLELKMKEPGFYVSFSAHLMPSVMKVLEQLEQKYAHMYMNLASSTGTFGNHVDTMEVIYWQCQGQTLWIIDQREQHILKPGDLITVPAGTYHNVIPLTPRLGISMATK